jgi:hypothetical protein
MVAPIYTNDSLRSNNSNIRVFIVYFSLNKETGKVIFFKKLSKIKEFFLCSVFKKERHVFTRSFFVSPEFC